MWAPNGPPKDRDAAPPGVSLPDASDKNATGKSPMIDHKIVDSHVHLADPSRFSYGWTAAAPSLNRTVMPADLTAAAAPYEIDRFVFVEVDVDPPQEIAEAEWVVSLAQEEPRLQGIVACARLEQGAAVEADLEKLAALKNVKSIRRLIQNQPDPEFCLRPDFLEGLALLPRFDLSFDICIFHHHLPNVIEMVRRNPDVRFVLDHIGKPAIREGLTEPWMANIRTLAGFENVFCKISGVVTEADPASWTLEEVRPYIEHAIESFGFERCMYGGDWHVVELACPYPRWVETVDTVTAGASAHERQKLFRDTAISFYRLDA